MKNKMSKILKIVAISASCLMFASFSPSLDGRAVVVDEGVFPQGLFAKTVGYLPGDIISVASISSDSTVDLLVIGALDPSEGVAIMLSPEAAASIGIDKTANNIVKITKRSGQDERVYGNAVIAKNTNVSEYSEVEAEKFDSTIASENTVDFDEEIPESEDTVEEDMEEEPFEEETEEYPAEENQEEFYEQPVEESLEDAVEEEAIEEELEDEDFEDIPLEDTDESEEDEEAEVEEEYTSEEPEDFDEEIPEETEEYETITAEPEDEEPETEAPVEETVEEEEELPSEEIEDDVPDVPEEVEETEEEELEAEAVEAETLDDIQEETPVEEPEVEEDVLEESVDEEPIEDTEPLEELEAEPETEDTEEPEVTEEEEIPVEEEEVETEEPEDELADDEYEAIVLVPADSNPPEENVEEVLESENVEPEIVEPEEPEVVEEEEPEVLEDEVIETYEAVEDVESITGSSINKNVASKKINAPSSYKKYMVNSLSELKSGAYYIQIAALSEDKGILEIIEKYSNNYPITIVPMAGGIRKQIMIGPLNMDEYAVVLERFKSYGYKDAFLRKIR